MKNIHRIDQRIFITNDKKIKKGNWFWKPDSNMIFRAEYTPYKGCQKVILTNNEELIYHGVQAIDEQSLEWFLDNPNCEEIAVVKGLKKYNDDGEEYGFPDMTKYRIIFPKELKKELKKESLEEVALKFYPRLINDPYNPFEDDNIEERDIWIKGAKWQQKQDKTKYKSLVDSHNKLLNDIKSLRDEYESVLNSAYCQCPYDDELIKEINTSIKKAKRVTENISNNN